MNDLNVCDLSLGFVEAQYARWVHDPQSVDGDWQRYFDGFEVDTDTRLRSVTGTSIGTPSLFDPDRPVSTDGEADDPTAMSATPDEAYALLRMLAVFREVPDDELEEVAGIVKELRFGDGDVVFRAGDPGNEMFVVLAGSVLVRRDRKVVAELEVGEVVGEMAVLDGLPRSADTVARGDVRLLRLNGDDLLGLLDRRPALARGILRTLTQRIRDSSARQDQVDQLIRAYRVRGHLIADLDPLGLAREPHPELDPEHYGFGPADMGRVFSSRTIPGTEFMTLDDILAHLRKVYCGSIGVQYMHIDDLDIKSWLQEQVEGPGHDRTLSREEQLHILTKLTDAEAFEQFIHRKFLGAKRFSLEGAESLIPLLDLAVEEAGAHGVEEIVIGMAHRGRLNVLANVLEKSPRQIFREFDDADADKMVGGGDVKYHLGYSSDRVTVHGDKVHLTLCFNPSHLEFVGPVVMGRVRSKQDRFRDYERRGRMGIVIHGDSAFAGQGVVQEMLNMGGLPGYTTGGTLHIIVNNQIGFTTPPQRARSTQYCTDVAKMLQVPIFHVNGEHPEAVARVIQLAMDFRQAFQRDVVVDMYCYRRYGHNETDEPAFTQPLMYEAIRKRKSVRDGYFENIEKLGELTKVDADRIAVERRQVLEDELTIARSDEFQPLTFEYGRGFWRRYHGGPEAGPIIDTSVPAENFSSAFNKRTRKLKPKQRKAGIRAWAIPLLDFIFRGFNMDDPLVGGLDPKKVALRKAIGLAIDLDEFNDTFYNSINIVYDGPIPPGMEGYPKGGKAPGHTRGPDMEKAAAKLAEAGYPGGKGLPEIEYWSGQGGNAAEQAEMLQRQLGKLGIKLKVRLVDFSQLIEAVNNKKAPIFSFSWASDYPDAENNLALFYGPNKAPGSNHYNYKNPTFDPLYEQVRGMPPSAERTALYAKMRDIVLADAPYLGSMARTRHVVANPWLVNFLPAELFHTWVKYLDVDESKRTAK